MESWQRLDRSSAAEAAALLRTCCGASRWVDRMLARRPFRSRDTLLQAAREEWLALSPPDWKEAFSHHPKLGDREALRTRFSTTRMLSADEQAGVTGAPDDVLDALAEGNRRYEQKFGYIFIADASGQPAEALLAALQVRLKNDPASELLRAAEEQAKITVHRLQRI